MQSAKNLTLTYARLMPSRSAIGRVIYSFLLLVAVGIAFPATSHAQQNEVVTDQTVIQLLRAGISKQIIMAKIENSQTNFDLSTNGLVYLKNNGVPDDIVATMINKNSNNSAAPNQQQPTNAQNPAQDGGDVNAQASNADDPNANTAPPELPTYEQPPCPTDGYLWQPGYWAFNLVNGYYWVPGVWVAPPQPGLLWTPGYWGYSGAFYVFHRGYWGASVGFYGGINYGYGYAGSGFYGGGWYGHVYRYNTAVVRVNTVVIHNVYVDRTVIHNTTVVNRTSFNGRGGIAAEPRPEELRAARETHIQATQEQIAHQREAGNDRNQFAKVNNGRPSQAATPRVSENAIKNQQNFQQSHGSGDRLGNKGQANNNNPNQPNSNGGAQSNGGNRAGNNDQKSNNPNQPNINGGAQGNGGNRAGNNEQKSNNPNQAGGNGNATGNNGTGGNEPKTNNPSQPAGNGNAPGNNANPNNPSQPAGNGGNANNNQKQAAPKKGGFFNNLKNNAQQHNQQQQKGGNNNNQQKQPKEEKKNDKKH